MVSIYTVSRVGKRRLCLDIKSVGFRFCIFNLVYGNFWLNIRFFHISGSLFKVGSGYQQSFLGLMGSGAFVVGYGSGRVVDYFIEAGYKNWSRIWFAFALYALLYEFRLCLFIKLYKREGKKI